MSDIQQFVNEYSKWSSQEKFKDFSFIDKISETWKDRLLNNKKFNIWAFLFGPAYYLYLGLFFKGIVYVLLSAFLLTLWPIGPGLYLLFALVLGFRANTNYLKKLQKNRKLYADFNPDADTPYFNISSKRLILLSLLTGGFYLIYWGYRNLKAVKDVQKDDINPFWNAVFIGLTSVNVFRSIAHSSKLVNYGTKFKPVLSAILFLFLFGGGGYNTQSKAQEDVPADMVGAIVLTVVIVAWLFTILTTLLINKYQKAIKFYCDTKGLPSVKDFTAWEIVLIVLGAAINLPLMFLTFIAIVTFL